MSVTSLETPPRLLDLPIRTILDPRFPQPGAIPSLAFPRCCGRRPTCFTGP